MSLDSQLTTHRPAESQHTTRKLLNLQIETRKLLGLQFTDTQLAGLILESLTYQNSVWTLFWCYLSYLEQINNNDFIKLGAESLNVNNYFSRNSIKYGTTFTRFL